MFTISFFANSVLKKNYENKAIHNRTNKAFNGFMQAGADTVTIPALSAVQILDLGTDPDANAGVDVKGDTGTITINVVPKMVRIKESLVSKFNAKSGLNLFNHYVDESNRKLVREYNKLVIEAAFGTANKFSFSGAAMVLNDIIDMKEFLDNNEVPEEGRVLVVDSRLQKELWAIPFVQQAAAFNSANLKSGVFVEFFGFTVYVSALPPQYNGKRAMVAWWEPSNAFLLGSETNIESVYIPKLGGKIHDIYTFSAYKQLDDTMACVKYQK